jgi:hypothetical protein
MDPILLFALKWYLAISVGNLAACFIMMYAHTKTPFGHKLGWHDVWWTIGLTIAGPLGTGAIIFAMIQVLRDTKKEKKAKKQFNNDGGQFDNTI